MYILLSPGSLRRPHWPCYSSNLQSTLLIHGPCPRHSRAWNTLPPHSFNIHSLPSAWTMLKCHLSTGAPLTTLYVKTPPPRRSLVSPGALNMCLFTAWCITDHHQTLQLMNILFEVRVFKNYVHKLLFQEKQPVKE